MANDNTPPQEPLGKKIRDLINPALADDRREKIQLDMLDKAFAKWVDLMPQILTKEFQEIFNYVSKPGKDAEDKKNPIIITALTTAGKDGESPYMPVRRMKLDISTDFTTFSAEDIKQLPNYIRLHEAARELDVALNVKGLVGDETKSSNPVIVVDATKTYEEGASENFLLYPNLPPRKVDFTKEQPGKEFRLE